MSGHIIPAQVLCCVLFMKTTAELFQIEMMITTIELNVNVTVTNIVSTQLALLHYFALEKL